MKEYPGRLIALMYRRTQSYWTHALKEYDITSAEYPVLLMLSKKEGITQEEIAEDLGVDKSAITRTVKSLQEKGYILRQKDDGDLRCNRIYLTEKGHSSQQVIKEGKDEWNHMISRNLKPEDMEEFIRILELMADNMEDYFDRH